MLNQSFPAIPHRQDETTPIAPCLKKKADHSISWFVPPKSQASQKNSVGATEKLTKK